MLVTIEHSQNPGDPRKPGPWEGRQYEVPTGCCLVEFMGDQSPFDDPYVAMRISVGGYTRDQVELLREMARRAIKPWRNLRRILHKGQGDGEFKHFSRTYVFGHGNARKPLVEPGEPGSF